LLVPPPSPRRASFCPTFLGLRIFSIFAPFAHPSLILPSTALLPPPIPSPTPQLFLT
jgi:hypothetical protein